MLTARSLRKAKIPTDVLQDPSPGGIQPTRLALHVQGDGGDSSYAIYVASGCHLYGFEVSDEGVGPVKGKDSLLVPAGAQIIHPSVVDRCPHRSEIQSIALARGDHDSSSILGSVDAYGHLIVSQFDANGTGVERNSYSICPRGYGVGEGSWAGICFSPTYSSMVATVHSFCKSLDIYDQDIHLHNYQTLWYPNSVSFLQCSQLGGGTSSVLAVAEGSQVTVWDLRVSCGCVQRVCGSVGDLIYAISGSPSGAVAVGGSDRTVTIYDSRRWSALKRWVSCSKYEITGLAFSSLNQDYIYVQGVDYEVFCGEWKESKKIFSFRGDSNWLGFGKDSRADVLAGWCDSGSVFVADVERRQLEASAIVATD